MARDSVHVYVLYIHHRNGDDYAVYTTEEAARAALAEYCREWWDSVKHDNDPREDTFNDEGIINLYFEREYEERCEEDFEVSRCEIEGAAESLASLNGVINIIRSLGVYLTSLETDDEGDVIRLSTVQWRLAQAIREIQVGLDSAHKALPWLGSMLADPFSATDCNSKTSSTPKKRALDLTD